MPWRALFKGLNMGMIKCHECGAEISSQASACPKCGAKPKSNPWIAAGIFAAIAYFSFQFFSTGTVNSSSTKHTVTYEVQSTSGVASLTYQNEQGGTEQREVATPWSRTMQMTNGSFLYVSAQNPKEWGDTLVIIRVNGIEVKQSRAQGGFTIATANMSCC